MLPSFAPSAQPSFEAAREAEGAGLHGVFAYHHLWPIGHRGRPALWPSPLLGAVAGITSRIALGTLVARVGLVPLAVLESELVTLDAVSGGRLVAGVGTGDAKSADEHAAFGLDYAGAGERRGELLELSGRLLAAGVTTWVGSGRPATNALARTAGAVLNFWSVPAPRVAAEAVLGPVTWGGRFPRPAEGGWRAAAELIGELAESGAGWVVFTWAGSVAPVAEAARSAGVRLADPWPDEPGASDRAGAADSAGAVNDEVAGGRPG